MKVQWYGKIKIFDVTHEEFVYTNLSNFYTSGDGEGIQVSGKISEATKAIIMDKCRQMHDDIRQFCAEIEELVNSDEKKKSVSGNGKED